MPGGLLQLVGVGAQNELVNGNPSMTHFRAVYRRHTNFAMEHFRIAFSSSNLEFAVTGTRTLSCKIERYAQLLHDCYLSITLPDIWSPLKYLGTESPPTGYPSSANSIGYEFQWIKNIGYNLIDNVEVTANGVTLQRLRGEWLKLYSYLTHERNKRLVVDEMVGNVSEVYDPANAYDRLGQYPHAVAPNATPTVAPGTAIPEPSIRGRQLIIPLHFFFCENPGTALPLVSLQNSDIYINVNLRALQDLYTVIDVNPSSLTYGQRVKPVEYPIGQFLSPPLASGLPSNPTITTFFPDPYIEANFIYLTEMEMNQLATADQAILVKTVQYVNAEGQFGGNTDLEIPFFNLVTRMVFSSQRIDKIQTNDWDNYTNWENPDRAPWTSITSSTLYQTPLYTSGQQQVSSVYPRDTIIDAVILLDGKERFAAKPYPFFSLLQMYRHTTGNAPEIPGVYQYSFALNNDQYQPSGAINGSMFNKVILRLTLQQPLPQSVTPQGGSTSTEVCVLKSTLFSPNPVVIPPGQIGLYTPDQIVTVVQTNDNVIFTYTYNAGVYVESINFLRIVSGLANLVFAS
jgi:hypothetical protein